MDGNCFVTCDEVVTGSTWEFEAVAGEMQVAFVSKTAAAGEVAAEDETATGCKVPPFIEPPFIPQEPAFALDATGAGGRSSSLSINTSSKVTLQMLLLLLLPLFFRIFFFFCLTAHKEDGERGEERESSMGSGFLLVEMVTSGWSGGLPPTPFPSASFLSPGATSGQSSLAK